jgi:CheY-like chemotaxis protein
MQILTITATKEIRALGYTAPIFGVTGNSLPSDVAHFKLHGADVVLIKPLDIDDFKRAMQGEVTFLTIENVLLYYF